MKEETRNELVNICNELREIEDKILAMDNAIQSTVSYYQLKWALEKCRASKKSLTQIIKSG